MSGVRRAALGDRRRAVPGLQRTARRSLARSGLPGLLAGDSAPVAAALPDVWRSAPDVAGAQPAHRLHALPPDGSAARPRALRWSLRRRASRHCARLQVRRASLAGRDARASDARTQRRRARRRRSRGAGTAALVASPAPRIQSGGRSGGTPWSTGDERAATDTGHGHPDPPALGTAASQCPRRVRAETCGARGARPDRRPRGRCQYHRGDVGGLRAGVESLWSERGTRAHRGAGRDPVDERQKTSEDVGGDHVWALARRAVSTTVQPPDDDSSGGPWPASRDRVPAVAVDGLARNGRLRRDVEA